MELDVAHEHKFACAPDIMIDVDRIVTARLDLRPFRAADVPAIHAIYSDADAMRFVGHGAVRDVAYTEQMLRGYRDHQRRHGFSFWAVVERESGAVIGDAGLLRSGAEVELGYTLGRRWWGRGYATEAARAWLEHALGPLGLPGVVALVEPGNVASVRVLEKLGFVAAGERTAYGRPHLVFRAPPPAGPISAARTSGRR